MNRIQHPLTGLTDYRPELARAREPRFLRGVILGTLLALAFILGFATGIAHAAEPCVQLQVRPQIMLSRGDIRVEMRVARHADHQRLVLAWDAGAVGAGSSSEQLEGSDSPVLHTRWLKAQPAAAYAFVAAVFDDKGHLLGRDTAEIYTPVAVP